MDRPRPDISGNILIYILGAIVLIGLLVMALRSNFQDGAGIDGERTALAVTQVQRYASELERGVAYILRNGFSETDLRFAHPDADAAYGDIGDNPARQVFAPEGGGVEWRDPPRGIQTTVTPWHFSARSAIDGAGTTCTNQSCVDLAAYLPNVTKEFCILVNNANAIENPSGDAPVDSDGFTWDVAFADTFSHSGALKTAGDHTAGKMEGCVKHTTLYYYYRVLLAR